jgi:hypothetical protein
MDGIKSATSDIVRNFMIYAGDLVLLGQRNLDNIAGYKDGR